MFNLVSVELKLLDEVLLESDINVALMLASSNEF